MSCLGESRQHAMSCCTSGPRAGGARGGGLRIDRRRVRLRARLFALAQQGAERNPAQRPTGPGGWARLRRRSRLDAVTCAETYQGVSALGASEARSDDFRQSAVRCVKSRKGANPVYLEGCEPTVLVTECCYRVIATPYWARRCWADEHLPRIIGTVWTWVVAGRGRSTFALRPRQGVHRGLSLVLRSP